MCWTLTALSFHDSANSYPFRGLLGIVSRIAISVRQLVRQLEDDGWVQVRQRGSHRQFRHPKKSGTVTVAGKESADVPPGTLSSVLKQAGLKSQRQRKPEGEP
jgi:predicted RNA binding protein YcfA (HicA-like mRNA interferase family)